MRLFRDFLDVGTRISVAGRYLVEVAPVLRHLPAWFPGAQFKREAAAVRARLSGTVELLYKQGKETTVCPSLWVLSGQKWMAHLVSRRARIRSWAANSAGTHTSTMQPQPRQRKWQPASRRPYI